MKRARPVLLFLWRTSVFNDSLVKQLLLLLLLCALVTGRFPPLKNSGLNRIETMSTLNRPGKSM